MGHHGSTIGLAHAGGIFQRLHFAMDQIQSSASEDLVALSSFAQPRSRQAGGIWEKEASLILAGGTCSGRLPRPPCKVPRRGKAQQALTSNQAIHVACIEAVS